MSITRLINVVGTNSAEKLQLLSKIFLQFSHLSDQDNCVMQKSLMDLHKE